MSVPDDSGMKSKVVLDNTRTYLEIHLWLTVHLFIC